MKFPQSTYLLALVLFFQACDPVFFDTEDDEPEFSVEFTVGGESYSFAAGEEDFFMYTEVPDPFFFHAPYKGVIGIPESNGLIDQSKISLGLTFQESESVFNSDDQDHFNSFQVGEIPIKTDDNSTLPSKEVKFNGVYDGTGSDPIYSWDFGDESSVDFESPVHAYNAIKDYESTLRIVDSNQCEARSTNTVSFDGRDDCNAKINLVNISSEEAILEAVSSGSAPFTYLWSDGSSSSDNLVSIESGTSNQSHCVTITDSNGCESSTCIGIIRNSSGTINTCSAQMTEENYKNIRAAPQFNSVNIEWRPGIPTVEFLSKELQQPSDSRFEIISFEEFKVNARGERTVKIEFEVSCMVWETLGSNPQKLEGSGTIAVAIPD